MSKLDIARGSGGAGCYGSSGRMQVSNLFFLPCVILGTDEANFKDGQLFYRFTADDAVELVQGSRKHTMSTVSRSDFSHISTHSCRIITVRGMALWGKRCVCWYPRATRHSGPFPIH